MTIDEAPPSAQASPTSPLETRFPLRHAMEIHGGSPFQTTSSLEHAVEVKDGSPASEEECVDDFDLLLTDNFEQRQQSSSADSRDRSRLMEGASDYRQRIRSRARWPNSYSVRESLLAEAWERKRIHYRQLQEELKIEEQEYEEVYDDSGEADNDEAKYVKERGDDVDSANATESFSTEEQKYPVRRRKGRSISLDGSVLDNYDTSRDYEHNVSIQSPSRFGQKKPEGNRARRLTEEDFEELRGSVDLGLVGLPSPIHDAKDDDDVSSNYSGCSTENSMEELCETLPALRAYYTVSNSLRSSPVNRPPYRRDGRHRGTDEAHHMDAGRSRPRAASASPRWRISMPGIHLKWPAQCIHLLIESSAHGIVISPWSSISWNASHCSRPDRSKIILRVVMWCPVVLIRHYLCHARFSLGPFGLCI